MVSTQPPPSTTPNTPGFHKFREDCAQQRHNHRNCIRRCFMNGKQCIFGEKLSQQTQKDDNDLFDVFVVMPYRNNLDTFYEWSLKPFLDKGLGLQAGKETPLGRIMRADEYRNTGAVMCEKICLRIQEAELVVVDLTIDNPNVFYELGLAAGLGKPLLILCDSASHSKRNKRDKEFYDALGIDMDKVIPYPNLDFLDGAKYRITFEDHVTFVNHGQRDQSERTSSKTSIVPLLVDDTQLQGYDQDRREDDLHVDFLIALKTALLEALRQLNKNTKQWESMTECDPKTIQDALGDMMTEVETFNRKLLNNNYIIKQNGSFTASQYLAPMVEDAFICIIDLADEKPLSYFWLGYCHARGINAIPIYRYPSASMSDEDNLSVIARRDAKLKHDILAFDIRAMWYIDFSDYNIRALTKILDGNIAELVTRDIPTYERSRFWERLTRERQVSIFTGALHSDKPEREVVGDWDLRTVSELVRYLSSSNESVLPFPESPMYSLKTILINQVAPNEADHAKFDLIAQQYIARLKKEIENKNCLIIASADVNPLTECILAELYQVDPYSWSPAAAEHHVERDNTVVASKAITHDNVCPTSTPQPFEEVDTYLLDHSPYFSRASKDVQEKWRGFLIGSTVIQAEYHSQFERHSEDLYVLAHLVVAKNPFPKEHNRGNYYIAVLNGVSGPGTFGLAEMLTGGKTRAAKTLAEVLLAKINEAWDSVEKNQSHYQGVEVIVHVKIKPGLNDNETTISDARIVDQWGLCELASQKKLYENGRAVLTVTRGSQGQDVNPRLIKR